MESMWKGRVPMRRLTFLASIVALAAGLMFVGAKNALADDCLALSGNPLIGGECVVNTPRAVTGVFNLDETLRITGNGRIDASGDPGGITLNICFELPAVVGPCDFILETPSALNGGQTEADDNAGLPDPNEANDNASPITIKVSRDLLMKAGSAILTENLTSGGSGGDINITVGRNMTMCGPAGAQPGCGGPGAANGALISSRKFGSASGGVGGFITIKVGDVATATGAFYMEGGSTVYGAETGAKILASGSGPAGDISVTSGKTYFTEPGSVVEAGGPFAAQTATAQGGKIFLVSDCGFTTEGRVTSKGPDFGADLVHLESCEVIIRGLVESTGKGHASDAANSCDNVNDGLPGEVLRNHPAESTGCIEVWGNVITIDSFNLNPATNLPWAGELNADIGNGGPEGTSWIDIFAFSKLTVTDGTGNDRLSDNLGDHIYFSTYAVHANAMAGSDHNPGVVTALVKNGPLTASGKAFEASSTLTSDTGHAGGPGFVGNGSNGGTIDLEASGTVTLDTAFVNASGDFFGGTPCPSGSGACGAGGHIIVSAWGAGSNMSWQNGDGDVRNNDDSADPPPPAIPGGTIDLNACGLIDTTGTNFHGEVPTETHICDATKPTIPTITVANGGPVFKTDLWALCGESSISGIKFNDLNADHVRDGSPLEPGLLGWEIKLWDAATQTVLVATTTTAADGSYSFPGVAPGSYVVCETLQAPLWTQTAPVAGPGIVPCNTGGLGYTVLVGGCCDEGTCTGQPITGKDFGNNQAARPPECKEDPNRAALLTRTVDLSKPNLSGGGVPGDPKNYWLVQAAYNDAKVSAQAEVIGLLANTSENLLLNGDKSLTITQCTVARVTGAAGSPVWNITNTKKLTIISPDSVGGTVGWRVQTNGHDLKSIRATGASMYGIQIIGNSNSVSTNSVSGSPEGIRVEGDSNTVKSGTISGNGIGVHFTSTANGNTLSGSTVRNNTGDGIFVEGSGNKLDSDKVYSNGGDGVHTSATATSTTLKSVGSGSSGENGGAEFRLGATAINGGGNKADGVNVPSAAKGCATFNAGSVCE